MSASAISLIVACVILFAVDIYVLSGLQTLIKHPVFRHRVRNGYIIFSVIMLTLLFIAIYVKLNAFGLRALVLLIFFLLLTAKVFFLPFIVTDDIRRGFIFLKRKIRGAPIEQPKNEGENSPPKITRSEFLMKAGLISASLPLVSLSYGIISGAYDYRIRRQKLVLKNLPKAFDGLKLAQVSDIHSGSFYNKTAVNGGIDMLLGEKPDMIFFTGDLVNNMTSEVRDYQSTFARLKAPLGVYSTLGNHDYGDYHAWPSRAAKEQNLRDIVTVHKQMGYDLLMNENRRIKIDGEEIGVLGIENWGALSRFPRYGKMDLAVKNTGDLPVKLLLSHDPSHWRAQVLPQYPQIDAMFSGHTHGMQFGVRFEHFQWSPIQYVYKEWAGLYHEKDQQLYVNTGYGFLGYPGRVGILPEITIFELKQG
ncbi:MAG: metallophosphoesterase [Mucilaginibacter polytrichastri]|nr:metallophosphoesterase [Mucilaginibacter polytrichastri]